MSSGGGRGGTLPANAKRRVCGGEKITFPCFFRTARSCMRVFFALAFAIVAL